MVVVDVRPGRNEDLQQPGGLLIPIFGPMHDYGQRGPPVVPRHVDVRLELLDQESSALDAEVAAGYRQRGHDADEIVDVVSLVEIALDGLDVVLLEGLLDLGHGGEVVDSLDPEIGDFVAGHFTYNWEYRM